MKSIYLLALVLLTISCSQQLGSSKKTNRNVDTLSINGKIYTLDSISEKEYASIDYKFPLGNDTIAIDTSRIKLTSKGISIKTDETTVDLLDDTTGGESYAQYKYLKTFNNIGFVHIKGMFWEWTEDIFVSLKDGKKVSMFNNPILSPNRKLLLSYNADLIAQFMANGIQTFRIEDSNLIPIFSKEVSNWGPEEVKWESDTSIVIKRLKVDYNSSDLKESTDYVRMIIK